MKCISTLLNHAEVNHFFIVSLFLGHCSQARKKNHHCKVQLTNSDKKRPRARAIIELLLAKNNVCWVRRLFIFLCVCEVLRAFDDADGSSESGKWYQQCVLLSIGEIRLWDDCGKNIKTIESNWRNGFGYYYVLCFRAAEICFDIMCVMEKVVAVFPCSWAMLRHNVCDEEDCWGLIVGWSRKQ